MYDSDLGFDPEERYGSLRATAPRTESEALESMNSDELESYAESQIATEKSWAKEVAEGAGSLFVTGPVRAAKETWESMQSAASYLDEKFGDLGAITYDDEKGFQYHSTTPEGFENPQIPDIKFSDDAEDEMLAGFSQFLTGFFGAGKFIKGKDLLSATAKGAAADAIAFDPDENNLSGALRQMFPDNDLAVNSVTEYLAKDDDDSELEKRMKNALEGTLIGGTTDVVLKGIKYAKEYMKGSDSVIPKQADEIKVDEAGNVVRDVEETPEFIKRQEEIDSVELVSANESKEVMDAVASGDFNAYRENVHFNIERIQDGEGIREIINKTSDMYSSKLDSGVRTHAEVVEKARGELADSLGMSVEKLMKVDGKLENLDSKILASRDLMASSAKNLYELAEKAKHGTPEDEFRLRRAVTQHQAIQAEVKGIKTEVARALNAMKIEARSQDEYLDAINRWVDQTGGSAVNRKLADEILKIKAKSPEALNKELNQVVGRSWAAKTMDVLNQISINGMLSGVSTQVVNGLGNAVTMALGIGERALAGRTGEAVHMAEAMFHHSFESLSLMAKALKSGEGSDLFTKAEHLNQTRAKPISGENLNLSGFSGQLADFAGEVIDIPGRLMLSQDEFFKNMNYRADLAASVYREADNLGLKGDERATFVKDMMENPSQKIHDEALEYSHFQTFTNDLEGKLKEVQNFTNSGGVGGGIAKQFLPFVRTPANILRYTGDRTPLVNKWLRSYKEAHKLAQEGDPSKLELHRGKVRMGSMMYMTGFTLAANDLITGAGPVDKNERKALMAAGWQPYSLKFGDKYVSYKKFDPIGSFLGLAADGSQLISLARAKGDDHVAGEIETLLAMSVAGQVTDKTFLTGLDNLVKLGTGEAWERRRVITSMTANFVPYGSLGREVTRESDPYMRDAVTLIDQLRSRYLMSESVAPTRNILGEKIAHGRGFGNPFKTTSKTNDRVLEVIALTGVNVDGMRQIRTLGKKELSPVQKDRWRQIWGELNKKELNALVEELPEDLTQINMAEVPDEISSIISINRRAAKFQLMEEFPELEAHFEKDLEDKKSNEGAYTNRSLEDFLQ